MALYITFTKWDLHMSPLPERNMWFGSRLCLSYFAYSLAHVWITLKISFCFELKEFTSAISSSGNICGMKLGSVEILFVSSSSESLPLGQSAKLRALRAHVPTCLACLRAHLSTCPACLHAYMLTCQCALRAYMLMCQRALRAQVLMCQRALRAFVVTCHRALRVYVLTYQHAYVLTCLAC